MKIARVNTEAILRNELRRDCKTFIHRFDSDRRLQITQPKTCRRNPSLGSLNTTFNSRHAETIVIKVRASAFLLQSRLKEPQLGSNDWAFGLQVLLCLSS